MAAHVRGRGSVRRLSWFVVLGLAAAAFVLPTSAPALAAQDKIDICHSTGADGNPYVVNQPDKTADAGGHAGHTGPIWSPGADTWGDIIPPFDFDGGHFDGLNWTAEGRAIYENKCNIPDPTPTVAPTEAPTAAPTEAPTAAPTEAPTPTPTAPPEPTPTGGVGGDTATPTPTGGVAGATATPPTLPRTDSIDGSGTGSTGDGLRVVLLAMAGLLAAALVLTPAKAVVRKDDDSR
jgi:hypothetical protein